MRVCVRARARARVRACVFACVCVCVCVRLRLRARARVWRCGDLSECACAYAYVRACVILCGCVRVHARACVCNRVRLCACARAPVRVRACVGRDGSARVQKPECVPMPVRAVTHGSARAVLRACGALRVRACVRACAPSVRPRGSWLAVLAPQDTRVTLKSDSFAFGVLMWEMATRMLPWHGLGMLAVRRVPLARWLPAVACRLHAAMRRGPVQPYSHCGCCP